MIEDQDVAAMNPSSNKHAGQVSLCRPFVKWAGGKTQLLSQLYVLAPHKFDRYFEPFLGGGALFLHLISEKNMRFRGCISDINHELINSYLVVKDNVQKLIQLLKLHQIRYNQDSVRYYYDLRDCYKYFDKIERAAQFIVLNRTCYNGLYRVNRNGKFNVPKGNYKHPIICDSTNLTNVSIALRYSNTRIECSDYKQILDNAKQGDFVYLDPPYSPSGLTANFTKYTTSGFSYNDQKELAEIFGELDAKGCNVMMTNSNTPLTRKLYSDFINDIIEVESKRAISCKSSKRAGHTDLIIRNYSDSKFVTKRQEG